MISLDASSTSTGWAYWENAVLKESGILCASGDAETRMNLMGKQILSLLKEKNPIIVVIEQPPAVNDQKTFRLLSELVGMARGWAALKESPWVDYVEYEPNVWRRFVADTDEKIPLSRVACKPWDITKAKDLLQYETDSDDEADAILIGYARIKEMCG